MPRSPNEKLIYFCLSALWTSNILNAWGVFGLYGTGLRVGASVLCGGVGVILVLTSQSWNRRAGCLLTSLFIVALVTLTYSLAPLLGFVGTISGLGTMMFFLGVAHEWQEYYWKKVISYSCPIWIVACVLSFAHYIIAGGWGELRFRTILGGGNSVGPFAASMLWLSCIRLRYVPHSRHFWAIVSCGLFLALLGLSTCRAAMGGFVILGLVLLSVRYLGVLGRKICLLFLMSSLPCLFLVVGLRTGIRTHAPANPSLDEKLEQLLVGRVYIWQHAIMAIREKPLLGYGIGSSGIALGLMARPGETVHYLSGDLRSDVHNSYLDCVIALGLLGSLPFFIVLLVTSWLALRRVSAIGVPNMESLDQFGVLGLGLICALTSITLFPASTPWAALTWCTIVGILMRPYRMSTNLSFGGKT